MTASDDALAALRAETGRLAAALTGLTASDWARPTRCAPWDAAALAAHVTIGLERLPAALAGPAPAAANVDAAAYFRPDRRYSAAVNTDRLDTAARRAEAGGAAVAADFDRARAAALAACAAAEPGRLVTTRHGDAMTLEDFVVTRVVEAAVHGIDLADALERPRWTTPEAAGLVCGLLLGPGQAVPAGWDRVGFIAGATGRGAFTDAELDRAASLGLRWLALGQQPAA